MRLLLVQGAEGSPNSSFGVYDYDNDTEVDFVQSDWGWPDLAQKLGAVLPDPDDVGVAEYHSVAWDWLAAHDGEVFEVEE